MIVTVTLNPMLDKTVAVPGIAIGQITRGNSVTMIVGGKGVNVSRQLFHLGAGSLATGFLGGEIGGLLDRLLTEEGLAHRFLRVNGMTREGVTYRHADGTMTCVFEPPHRVTDAEAEALVAFCAQSIHRGDRVICCGSSPCSEADTVYAEVFRNARKAGALTVLDSYGRVFHEALATAPDFVKLNRDECEQEYGVRLRSEADVVGVLNRFLAVGVGCAVITDGARAVHAATAQKRWRINPPEVPAVNPTGSGDSMLAAMVYGMEAGWPMEQNLRFGTAAGSANAGRWELACASKQEIETLVPHVHLEEI
jgi:tagatose 6-phosphate kinase